MLFTRSLLDDRFLELPIEVVFLRGRHGSHAVDRAQLLPFAGVHLPPELQDEIMIGVPLRGLFNQVCHLLAVELKFGQAHAEAL